MKEINKQLELPIKIYNDLWSKKSDGAIVSDNVFDAFRDEIEAWLRQEHALQYIGIDDDMPDDYDVWVTELMEGNEMLATIIN